MGRNVPTFEETKKSHAAKIFTVISKVLRLKTKGIRLFCRLLSGGRI